MRSREKLAKIIQTDADAEAQRRREETFFELLCAIVYDRYGTEISATEAKRWQQEGEQFARAWVRRRHRYQTTGERWQAGEVLPDGYLEVIEIIMEGMDTEGLESYPLRLAMAKQTLTLRLAEKRHR